MELSELRSIARKPLIEAYDSFLGKPFPYPNIDDEKAKVRSLLEDCRKTFNSFDWDKSNNPDIDREYIFIVDEAIEKALEYIEGADLICHLRFILFDLLQVIDRDYTKMRCLECNFRRRYYIPEKWMCLTADMDFECSLDPEDNTVNYYDSEHNWLERYCVRDDLRLSALYREEEVNE